MTDNEIIVPLKCLVMNESDCRHCKLKDKNDKCQKFLYSDVLGLIDENNRQKAEIERLEEVHKSLEEAYREQENYEDMIIKGAEVCARCHEEYAEKIKQAKAEAVKEVIARAKEYFNPDISFEFRKWLDSLEKELVGEDKTPSAENNFLYNRFMKKE